MQIDTSEIGLVAAKIMEDIEQLQTHGEFTKNARVVGAMVIYEVVEESEEEEGSIGSSSVGWRMTNDSSVLALGLMSRSTFGILNRGKGGSDD